MKAKIFQCNTAMPREDILPRRRRLRVEIRFWSLMIHSCLRSIRIRWIEYAQIVWRSRQKGRSLRLVASVSTFIFAIRIARSNFGTNTKRSAPFSRRIWCICRSRQGSCWMLYTWNSTKSQRILAKTYHASTTSSARWTPTASFSTIPSPPQPIRSNKKPGKLTNRTEW